MGKFEEEELKRVMDEKAKLQEQLTNLKERVKELSGECKELRKRNTELEAVNALGSKETADKLRAENKDLKEELLALRDCNNRRKANEEKYSELFELLYSIRQCQRLIDPKAAFDEIMGLYGSITES